MNHLFKKYDEIKGAGLSAIMGLDAKGKRAGQDMARAQIKQFEIDRIALEAYKSTLAPPKLGETAIASSFSYYECIDMLSDGPILGPVAKNGNKVLSSMLEGVYLDGEPVIGNRQYDYHYEGVKFDSVITNEEAKNNTVIRDTIGLRLDQTVDLITGFCNDFSGYSKLGIPISSYTVDSNSQEVDKLDIINYIDNLHYLYKAGYKIDGSQIVVTTPYKDLSKRQNLMSRATAVPAEPSSELAWINKYSDITVIAPNNGLKALDTVIFNPIVDLNGSTDPFQFIYNAHTVTYADYDKFRVRALLRTPFGTSINQTIYWDKVSYWPQRDSYVFNIAPLKKKPLL